MNSNAASRRDLLALSVGLAGSGALAACAAKDTAPAARSGDDAFPELTDQRGTAQPIGPEERAARRARLKHILARRGVDALFCEGGPTMTYLSGVAWGKSERTFGMLALADGTHFWICPAFEAEKAKLAIDEPRGPGGAIVAWEEHEYPWRPLAAALRERRVERIAIDPSTRCFVPELLRREFGAERVVFGRDVLVDLRGVKDAHELELLRKANELTQRAIRAVAERVHVGMNGDDVAGLMSAAHRKLGLGSGWCLALVGAAAAYPHGDNHAVQLAAGDFLLVDTGGTFHGYQSDITRTWCVGGSPSERQVRVWNAVRDAQQRAFDALRPGVVCGDVDRIARAALDGAGFGPGYACLTHRLGHGIGLEGHEDPYFDGGSEVALQSGMTLSNEPGIYLYGELGVRLEDIVAITDAGAEHFGNWQASPLRPD